VRTKSISNNRLVAHFPHFFFWAFVCKTVRPIVSDRCLSVLSVLSALSVCDVGVLWPNGWMHQDGTWRAGRLRPRTHCVRWGPSFPPKRDTVPNFRPMTVVAKWLDVLRCHMVWRQASAQTTLCYMGTQLPPKRVDSPQFSPHVYWGQTAGWIKMPVGTEVSLGLGDVVLDGHPAPPPKGAQRPLPQFSAHVYCGLMAALIRISLGTGTKVGLNRSDCVTWDPDPPPLKGHSPNFRLMSVVGKRLHGLRCHLLPR